MKKKTQPPVFIIGSERSGTTLLRLIITSHSQICIPPESLFLSRLYPKYSSSLTNENISDFVDDLFSVYFFNHWEFEKKDLIDDLSKLNNPNYKKVISEIYKLYAAREGKIRWGDKNPHHTLSTRIIQKLFPTAVFIHIIRDGRDAVVSLRDTWWGKKKTLSQAAKNWKKFVDAGNTFVNNNPAYAIELKYEELVNNPKRIVKNICSFLDIRYERGMMEFYKENRKRGLVPTEHQGFHTLTFGPITPKSVGKWKDRLSKKQLKIVETIQKDTLKANGYELYSIDL